MSESLKNHIIPETCSRVQESLMQESLENLVEFSLAMSHACAPGCVKIISIAAPQQTPGRKTVAPTQRYPSMEPATIIPFPARTRRD